MRLSKLTKRKWNWNYPALAFLMTCGGLLLLRLFCSLSFNGEYSMLYSDCYHQYYPFFLEFREALLSGDSLLYNWSVGMGMDYLGLISYYLASPLNLLSIFVPEGLVLDYFSLLMPLKLGFAAMFFAMFLKKVFKTNDISVAVFGCFYALCAWALGYQWNIMWLDTFALLPLVMMGMVSLLSEKKFMLYTITLFLSVACNYYIGFFTCIFVLLGFICYQICCWGGLKKFCLDLLRIAIFSMLAIAMTAFLTLPAFAALQNTQSSVNTFPTGFRLNIASKHTWLGLLDAMRQVAGNMNGGLEPTFKEGLPNVYCGIATNIFAFLFFTCRQVSLRKKLCTAFLLLFINLSFILRQLDYIWHGFHFTNMIPYRFSFLYSFVLLYMAYYAWTLRENFRQKHIAIAGALSVLILLCSNKIEDFLKLMLGQVSLRAGDLEGNLETIANHSTFAVYNIVFIVAYLSLLVYMIPRNSLQKRVKLKQRLQQEKNNEKKCRLGATVILCVMVLELGLNLVSFGSWFPGTNVTDYPKGTLDSNRAFRYIEQRENELFYRVETTHSQTLNDGALNGYNGISTFTSSANVKVTEFMRVLGYGAKNTYNRYCFEESSPVANLFLNLKYMVERDGKVETNPYFDDLHYFGKVHLLENNAYLPLGFCVDPALSDVDFTSSKDPFALQNEIMKKATGIEDDVWSFVCGEDLAISGTNVDITSKQLQSGYCAYNAKNAGYITYTYTVPEGTEGLMCIMVNQSKRNNITVFYNNTTLYTETYSLPQMLSVCEVKPGDVIKIRLKCASGDKGTVDIDAGVLDEALFRQGYDVLNASTLKLTSFENTHIEGTINCNRDAILYTSIPQNGNWIATVDGEEAEIVLIGDVMVGVRLTEGAHTVSFTYKNRAFDLGWKISLLSLLLLLVAYYIVYRPDFKRFMKKK